MNFRGLLIGPNRSRVQGGKAIVLISALIVLSFFPAAALADTVIDIYQDTLIKEGDYNDPASLGLKVHGDAVLTMTGSVVKNLDLLDSGSLLMEGGWIANVSIVYNQSLVKMSGGRVENLGLLDSSSLLMDGGMIPNVSHAYNQSLVEISGGSLGWFATHDTSDFHISGGDVYMFYGYDQSSLKMTGGAISWLSAYGSSVFSLYGGNALPQVPYAVIGAYDSSIINVYGSNFSYNPNNGYYGGGYLTGNWANGDPFRMDFYGTDSYNHVVLHPPFLQVSIDIKPGGINLRKTHQISVAIFSTGDFDAPSQIDQDSLTFGRTGSEHSLAYCNKKPKDIDGDGFKDLLCYFYTDRTAFQCNDNLGALNGYMVGGLPIRGSESVNIVPCK